MRAPLVVRWPGHIKPGTVKNDIFASLDWLPTLVDIAGGPKGNELKEQIEKGEYPGIVKTTLDGVNQLDYLKASRKSRRATPSSTTPARTRRRCATRTGRCTSRWCPSAPAGFIAGVAPLPLDPGRQHQARSLRDLGRVTAEDADRHGRRARRTGHRLHL